MARWGSIVVNLFAIQYLMAYCVGWFASYGKLPGRGFVSFRFAIEGHRFYPPTLEVASVKLFNVVLLPDEGLPTRPMRGSRGILGIVE